MGDATGRALADSLNTCIGAFATDIGELSRVLILRELLSPEGMAALCATGASVVLVDRAVLRPIADYYGMPDDMIGDGDVSKVSGLLTGAGCRVLP